MLVSILQRFVYCCFVWWFFFPSLSLLVSVVAVAFYWKISPIEMEEYSEWSVSVLAVSCIKLTIRPGHCLKQFKWNVESGSLKLLERTVILLVLFSFFFFVLVLFIAKAKLEETGGLNALRIIKWSMIIIYQQFMVSCIEIHLKHRHWGIAKQSKNRK